MAGRPEFSLCSALKAMNCKHALGLPCPVRLCGSTVCSSASAQELGWFAAWCFVSMGNGDGSAVEWWG